MSGLEAILEKIITDAEKVAQRLLADAKAEADLLAVQGLEDSRRQEEAILEMARQEAFQIEKRANSTAAQKAKQQILAAKVTLIEETLEAVSEALINLPPQDYFEMLKDFIRRHHEPKPATVVLTQRDQDRLPADFTASLETELGTPVAISSTPGNFKAGVVLLYGDIEYNGSVEALINENREKLKDLLNQKLFGE